MYTICPKCGSKNARYVADHQDVSLKCGCGYLKVIATKLLEAEVAQGGVEAEVKLPRFETNLWFTLVVLVSLQQATSEQVTTRLVDLGKAFTQREVASYLTLLRNKGLVYEVVIRRRTAGGSTWAAHECCLQLIGVDDGA